MHRIGTIGLTAVLVAAAAVADDNYNFNATDRLEGSNEAEVTQTAIRAFTEGDRELLRRVTTGPALHDFASDEAMRRIRLGLPTVMGPLHMTSRLVGHGPSKHVDTDAPGTLHRFFEVTVTGFDLAAPERKAVALVESGTDWRAGPESSRQFAFRTYQVFDFSLEPPVAVPSSR
jgi:hypothetical protein